MRDYKKILEGVVNIIDTTEKSDIGFANICSYIGENCPELKESEDKKMKKRIIALVNAHCQGMYKDKVLSWLEKQGKQQSTDKVEPKFHEGNFIKHNKANIICKVISVNSCSYYVEKIETSGRIELFNAEQNFHLWTIQNAKAGDVLAVEEIEEKYQYPFVAIYKERGLDFFNSYCSIGFDGKFYKADTGHSTKKIHPATKEQRDLLFQKMKEAGYEWDDEKKELKKIEQKHADKIEPKFHEGDWVVTSYGKVNQVITVDEDGDGFTLDDDTYFSGSWKDMYHLWTIQDAKAGDVLLSPATSEGDKECPFIFKEIDESGIVRFHTALLQSEKLKVSDGIINVMGYANAGYHIPATKEQRDLLFQKMKEAGYEWDAEKKELKKIEQKSAWSEEDENNLCFWLDNNKSIGYEKYRWLLSLKDRYTWRPSKAQMKAIEHICDGNYNVDLDILDSIYRDFKKLRGE